LGHNRAFAAINFKPTDIVPEMELLEHPNFIQKITGIDPNKNTFEAFMKAYKLLNLDMVLATISSTPNEVIRTSSCKELHTDSDGFTRVFKDWGVSKTPFVVSRPVKTIEDALSYVPTSSARIHRPADAWKMYHYWCREWIKNMGSDALVAGWHENNILNNIYVTFGWQIFSRLIHQYPNKLDEIINRFVMVSKQWAEGLSKIKGLKVVFSHDDIAYSQGLIVSPSWLRKHIFPHYTEVWKPFKDKGIKIVFVSDGKYEDVYEDLVNVGADGFQIEPSNSLEKIVDKYGGRKIIIGNVNPVILTMGTPIQVEDEVKRCIKIAGDVPGYFLSCMGGLPHNIPIENVEAYFKAAKKYRERKM
jgi:hypothetical protein